MGATVYTSPRYYDIAYGWDTRDEEDLLLACFRHFGTVRNAASLYEPGSGTGRMAIALARRGVRVTGLDRSDEMVAFAVSAAARAGVSDLARFETGPMEAVPEGEPCDGAFCLLSTFRYLTKPEDAVAHLASLARRLRAGACYAIDTRFAERSPSTPLSQSWQASRGGIDIAVRWSFEPPSPPPGVGKESLALSVRSPEGSFELGETSASRLDTIDSFEKIVAAAGAFEVAAYVGDRDVTRVLSRERAEGRVVAVLRRA